MRSALRLLAFLRVVGFSPLATTGHSILSGDVVDFRYRPLVRSRIVFPDSVSLVISGSQILSVQ